MKIAFITLEQMEILSNKEFTNSCLFNPIQIATQSTTSAAFITEVEVINCDNPEFTWVKDLEILDYTEQLTAVKVDKPFLRK
jgi:hypothetical protein